MCSAAAETEAERELTVKLSASREVLIGETFTVIATVTNKTRSSHTYRVNIRGRAMLYTGVTGQVVKTTEESITLPSGQCESGEVHVVRSDGGEVHVVRSDG